ncbi:glycosyltransferase family 4 protein, partial [Desulfovibrio sp. OttesenSCG-928-F20]|nr:glycosyltransferase family 4 protein [Desulfovibrio sp. OttesenSCG-928-F20]
MTFSLIYAKKLRLPSAAANVAQSLNMALAFGQELGSVRCFPGITDASGSGAERMLSGILEDLGADPGLPAGWTPLAASSKGGYGLRFRWALFTAALADKHSVFYARDLAEAAFLSTLSKAMPRPLFYEAHEVLFRMHEKDGKRDWQRTRQRERAVVSGAAGLIATSPVVAEELREHLDYTGPILVAPNGFSPALFHAVPLFEARAPWPGSLGPNDLVHSVYVGNLHQGKGVEELIEAMALLPERFRLTIIGGSPADTLEKLRNKAATTLQKDRIVFTGALAQKDIRTACLGAHIFVIPQQTEFFFSPLKLYEGLAMGLPVVMTPLSVFRAHTETGLVYTAPDTTPSGLAEALIQLARSPETARALRDNGLEKARAHTWRERAKSVLGFMRYDSSIA